MRINSKLGVQHATYDDEDAGEGLAIFFSQGGESVVRYRFLVKAMIDQGAYDMGEVYSSPPLATPNRPGRLSRMIASAVCPGATSWVVDVSAVPVDGEIVPETAEIILASSRCCSRPGVQRVGERYSYHSGSSFGGVDNFTVLAGMRITGVATIGFPGGGSMSIAGEDLITVPEGVACNMQPEDIISPNSVIQLTNVNWVIEIAESA